MQVLLTIISLIATRVRVPPSVLQNYATWPIGYLVPAIVIGSLLYLYYAHKAKNDKGAFLASCGYIVGMLVGAAFALYPMVLPASTDPSYSLTIYNTAAGAHGLSVGFVWWSIGMILRLVTSSLSIACSAARWTWSRAANTDTERSFDDKKRRDSGSLRSLFFCTLRVL